MPAGKPPIEFTREQIDRAAELLGRRVYPSRVATELQQPPGPEGGGGFGLSRDVAYRLIETARLETYEKLRGQNKADDPLTAMFLVLEGVYADDANKAGDRIAAATAAMKLLPLTKLLGAFGEDEAEEFLAHLAAKRKAKQAGGGA